MRQKHGAILQRKEKWKMKEIIVKTQAAFDAIPQDFDGIITIICKTTIAVTPRESARIALYGNSSAVLRDNSRADLWDNSSAVLCGNSSAALWDNSSAELWGNSRAELWGNSSAELWGNSSAVLRGNSRAELVGNSSAELWGNSQATDRTKTHEIKINGNARIVYDPRNIDEYLSFNGLPADGETCLLYKAVHKTEDGIYKSDHDNRFLYRIGEVAVADGLTTDKSVDCGEGIHLSYPAWAVGYGKNWDDLAILELQVKKSEVIVPENGCEKVRAKSAKVIREVPLEECGLLGEMVAKRNKKESEK